MIDDWLKLPQILTEILQSTLLGNVVVLLGALVDVFVVLIWKVKYLIGPHWAIWLTLIKTRVSFLCFDYPLVLFFSTTAKLFNLPLEVILKNNISLSYFIDFMNAIGTITFSFIIIF